MRNSVCYQQSMIKLSHTRVPQRGAAAPYLALLAILKVCDEHARNSHCSFPLGLLDASNHKKSNGAAQSWCTYSHDPRPVHCSRQGMYSVQRSA